MPEATAADPGPARAPDAAPPQAPAAPTPMLRLWRRYLKARGSHVGLVMIAVFGLVAMLAPFIAHRLPLYWLDAATGQYTFPLIHEFFAPSDTTEALLEKSINFLLVFTPLALAAWFLMGRGRAGLAGRESRLVSLLFGALFSALLWLAIGGMVVQGGGKDWFYHEDPPVPEVDDIDNPRPAPGAYRFDALRDRLAGHGFANPSAVAEKDAAGAKMDAGALDALRRALIPSLQRAISGEPLDKPSAVAALGVDTLDITDSNYTLGRNPARLNRIAVEQAYPGLLVPFRKFRTSFLMLAGVSLLVLLGLTYIFMAGAAQFALSPRWLILLALGAVVSVPFQMRARIDAAPYRQLAASGAGSGLFPLIPYGPNEQGFGPLLPPSWRQPEWRLGAPDVANWDKFDAALENPANPAAARVAERLDAAVPHWRDSLRSKGAGRDAVLAGLNRLLAEPALFDSASLEGLRRDIRTSSYLNELDAGRPLAPPHAERFNRLVLEQSLSGAFHPVQAGQWKKPNHTKATHLLGTDESGRDVLVRIIHGARVSLSVGFVSVFLATVIGLVFGSLAAYYGGWVDMAISRFMEVMMCFPSFFLILAVIAVLDRRSIVNIMLVIGLTSWTGVARLIRGEMLRQKRMEYVAASVALGAPDTRTIFRHILPNAMAPVLVSISFGITGAILTEAGLSFIGFGVTPPTPTWGQLLSETRDSPLANWWLAVFPGIVLFLGVLAYNLVGEALRDALDPRETL